jgi:anti-sigma factor RsiW
MTTEEQLAYLDHLQARVAAWNAGAVAFAARRIEPFVMAPMTEVWDIPHPYDDPPPEWHRVILASIGAGVTLACFATVLALAKS